MTPSGTDISGINCRVLILKPHNFRRIKTTLSVSRCDACQALTVASGISRGLVRCVDCGFCCHEKCTLRVSKDCPGMPQRRAQPQQTSAAPSSTTSGLPGMATARPWDRGKQQHHHYNPLQPRSSYTTSIPSSHEASPQPLARCVAAFNSLLCRAK